VHALQGDPAEAQGCCILILAMSTAKSIVYFFDQIPDNRRRAGQRHDQSFILLLVLMSTICGQTSYRAIGDFIERNRKDLIARFKPRKERLPTFFTVRRIMMDMDFAQISSAFRDWASQHVVLEKGEWVSADGKAIGGTVSGLRDSSQEFQSLVSIYCSKKRLSLGNALVTNSKESEQAVFKTLLSALDLQDATLTLDALHCQKKR
jgi:hypothetical protein